MDAVVSGSGLVEILKSITDPRGLRGRRFSSHSILSIAILATLSGANSLRSIAEWASGLSRNDLRVLGIKRNKAPSESAIRKFLARVDPTEVDSLTGAWLMAQAKNTSAIAVDGKTLRGTKGVGIKQCHLLSAVLHEEGLTVAQTKVDDKSNEITALKPLLEGIKIDGCIVTLDALHTQKETAHYLSEERDADYMMTVKGNQAGLKETIEAAGMTSFPPSLCDCKQGTWAGRNAGYSCHGERFRDRFSKRLSGFSD
jgi:hypothetical protein